MPLISQNQIACEMSALEAYQRFERTPNKSVIDESFAAGDTG
jgi:hypothetical protein